MLFLVRNTLVCDAEESEFSEKVVLSRRPDNSMETRKGSVFVRKWLSF